MTQRFLQGIAICLHPLASRALVREEVQVLVDIVRDLDRPIDSAQLLRARLVLQLQNHGFVNEARGIIDNLNFALVDAQGLVSNHSVRASQSLEEYWNALPRTYQEHIAHEALHGLGIRPRSEEARGLDIDDVGKQFMHHKLGIASRLTRSKRVLYVALMAASNSQSPDLVDEITPMALHPDPDARKLAITALAHIPSSRSFEVLLDLLPDLALGELVAEGIEHYIQRCMQTRSVTSHCLIAACSLVGKIHAWADSPETVSTARDHALVRAVNATKDWDHACPDSMNSILESSSYQRRLASATLIDYTQGKYADYYESRGSSFLGADVGMSRREQFNVKLSIFGGRMGWAFEHDAGAELRLFGSTLELLRGESMFVGGMSYILPLGQVALPHPTPAPRHVWCTLSLGHRRCERGSGGAFG